MLRLLSVLAGAVFVVSASAPARAQLGPDDYAIAHVVRPLREIGHIKARALPSTFCAEFSRAAAPAATAALAYETRLLDTATDLANFNLDNELYKNRSIRIVEEDLRELADDAKRGRAEIAALRASALERDDASGRAVVAFVDALDGAKGRQLDLTRKIARSYGRLSELETFSIANLPADAHGARDHKRGSDISIETAAQGSDPFQDYADRALPGGVLFSIPGDQEIEHDLERAALHAQLAETLEHC